MARSDLRNGVRKDGVCNRFCIGDVALILNFRISLKKICTNRTVEAEFSVQVLAVRVASGVDTEFPYQICIVDRGLIAATLFATTVSDSQNGISSFNFYGLPAFPQKAS